VSIPSTLKPGAYVLRHEIIALHGARSDDGAQAYPQWYDSTHEIGQEFILISAQREHYGQW
jgi:hypothetical protein